jgi:hypothetical protein
MAVREKGVEARMTETEAIRQNYELGVMAGEAREQQRIIKLFESRSQCSPIRGHDWNGDCYCEHIALIKGEK